MLMRIIRLCHPDEHKIMRLQTKQQRFLICIKSQKLKGKIMREYSKITPQFWLGSTGKPRGHIEAQVVYNLSFNKSSRQYAWPLLSTEDVYCS